MIGPLTRTPVRVARPSLPPVRPGQRRVLVTLGTHLDWAKRGLVDQARALRRRVPEIDVVVALGDAARAGTGVREVEPGLCVAGYVDYDDVLPQCDAVVHHAGTGVLYSTIRAGVPALAVPHDFDQHDYATRIEVAGAGLQTRAPLGSERAAARLREVLAMDRSRLEGLQSALRRYDPVGATEETILKLCPAGGTPAGGVGASDRAARFSTRRASAEQAELVALGVGQHDRVLALEHHARPEALQPGELRPRHRPPAGRRGPGSS